MVSMTISITRKCIWLVIIQIGWHSNVKLFRSQRWCCCCKTSALSPSTQMKANNFKQSDNMTPQLLVIDWSLLIKTLPFLKGPKQKQLQLPFLVVLFHWKWLLSCSHLSTMTRCVSYRLQQLKAPGHEQHNLGTPLDAERKEVEEGEQNDAEEETEQLGTFCGTNKVWMKESATSLPSKSVRYLLLKGGIWVFDFA